MRVLRPVLLTSLILGLGAIAHVPVASADHGTASGQSFTSLHPGFTQEIFGVSPVFMGGVAFAPDGDPWVDECLFSSSSLTRFDAQGTTTEVNATRLHPSTITPSGAGCGLTNHPNGSLYSNTGSGVVRLDGATGAQTAGPFGTPGNALGIAVDPVSGDLIYSAANNDLHRVDPGLTTTSLFSTATVGFVDGIAFDPSGDFLFVADRGDHLTIVRRDGTLAQSVLVPHEPDGISFHASAPRFVVTNNTDGTMTRFDFTGDNYAATPTQTPFASGGFRGDLSQVGPDGCLYLTQDGTRYDNGTTTDENSLVRICPGFAPPPGAGTEGPPGDPTCSDGVDNDGDTLTDAADPDCGPPPAGPPTSKEQCKKGGWRDFTIPRRFRNQGDCVSFVNTGR